MLHSGVDHHRAGAGTLTAVMADNQKGRARLRGFSERQRPQPRAADERRRVCHLFHGQMEPGPRPGALARRTRLGPLPLAGADRCRQLRGQASMPR
jgi:hypothetical protein